MAKGFGAPKSSRPPKFKSRFQTGFASKWGQTPKQPGPPKPKTSAKIKTPSFTKVGKV